MNFIAVVLLSFIPGDEDAFWALVFVMFERGWRDIFNQQSNKIAVILQDLEHYIQTSWPKLYDRF
jgi:hypothetical protein